MTRYIVYKVSGGFALGGSDVVPQFVFFREDDIKTGSVRPSSNPNLSCEPAGEIMASSIEDARKRYGEQQYDSFG